MYHATQVYDARDEMTLITELATGGELLDVVTSEKYITEIEVGKRFYIYFHFISIA